MRTVLAILGALALSLAAAGFWAWYFYLNKFYPYLEVIEQRVVGNELRLLLETSTSVEPRFWHIYRKDLKAWYITVDLASAAPLPARSRVYGPLWDLPGRSPEHGYVRTIHLTAGQAAAEGDAFGSPHGEFSPDGTLLRFAGKNWSRLQRSALVVTPTGGTWQPQGEYRPIDADYPQNSEDVLFSTSGRYGLRYEKGKATLYEIYTGQPVEDAWLTESFRAARTLPIPPHTDTRQFLTADLNHLVANPWEVEIDGRVYSRRSVDLVWDRPDPQMKIYPHPPAGEDAEKEAPHGAFSSGGKLLLLANTRTSLQLYTPDRRMKYSAGGPPFWPTWGFPKVQLTDGSPELVFFDTNFISREYLREQVHALARWNYAADTVRLDKVPLQELLEKRGSAWRPKVPVLPVK